MSKATTASQSDSGPDQPYGNLGRNKIEAHRPPTKYEIKIGEGATHYRTFEYKDFLKVDGVSLKRWIEAKDDKLRYYRY